MRHRALAVLVCTFAVLCAAEAWAQIPGCGNYSTDNSIWQVALNQLTVKALGVTSRDMSGCFAQVQVEIWVDGTMGGAGTARQTYVASDEITRYVPNFGLANSISKHWWIWTVPFESWVTLGEKHAQTNVTTSGPTGSGPSEEPACGSTYSWSDPICDCGTHPEYTFCGSPVLIDTAGDGYALTSVDRGVIFDLDCSGIPKRVAWTRPDSDDAWLAMDRNGNGKIDDGCELFGNHTPAYADRHDPASENGFVALRLLEGPSYGPSHADGIIDARDAAFGRLLLWRDANHNGISEPEELTPVSQTDLIGIGTDYKRTRREDRHGNAFLLRGKSYWAGPNGTIETRPVYDVWLRTEATDPGTSPE